MWRITPVFLFMCGVLTMHLAQADWSVLQNNIQPVAAEQAASVLTAIPTVTTPSPESLLSNMTLEEKVGQLLMIGHWREDYYLHTARLVDLYHLGGVILMKVSEDNTADVEIWTTAWQDKSTIPLLVSIDQEGGVVSRITADGYVTTGQRDITDTTMAYDIGYQRGTELRELGINTNLAPVLDYASTSDAFLFERSFASSTQLADLAAALIDGHTDAGVLAIPKHFPGHDSTPTDSHFDLPIIDISAAEFPYYVSQFRAVLEEQDVQAMMTAHVQFPKLDNRYPTTMSEEILSRQLRRELDFDGVIVTDDMTMGAITNEWSTNAASVRALQAGADMILFAADPNAAIEAHEYITQAVLSGELAEEDVDRAVQRILELKQTQGLLQ